ncbi:MAG: ABC transporter ATP-binding protein [Candidatus Woesearchaeota archaeon]
MNSKNKELIYVNNVSYSYGKNKVLDNISFKVFEKEVLGIIGKNGSGKSTLIHLLSTIKTPKKGKIIVKNCKNQDEQRKIQSVVFQDQVLDFGLTPLDVLEIQCMLYDIKYSEEDAKKLLKFFSLYDVRNNLIKTFSGGMKRKVELARALITKPKILLLDEPTNNLDKKTRINFLDYIKELGITIIFVSNNPDEIARISNRVILIKKGKLEKEVLIEKEKIILECKEKFDCKYNHKWDDLTLTIYVPSRITSDEIIENIPLKYIKNIKIKRSNAYDLFNF